MTRDLPQPVPPPDQTQIACTTTATKNADECMNKQNKGEKKKIINRKACHARKYDKEIFCC